MKKGTKTTLIVLGSIFAFIGVLFIVADLMLSSLLTKEVNKALAELPGIFHLPSVGGQTADVLWNLPPVVLYLAGGFIYLRWCVYLRWAITFGEGY